MTRHDHLALRNDRFAFVPTSSAGLLLDLDSGVVFRLNGSAALTWRLRLSGQSDADVATALAARYGIERERALRDLGTLDQLALADGELPPKTEFDYRRSSTGFVQSFRGSPVLEVDARGETLCCVPPASGLRPRGLQNFVRAITPKILALRGHLVLHASAVSVGNKLLVFLGLSGAGKSTTAGALVTAGAKLVSEDKLLVQAEGAQVTAWRDAEPRIDAWVMRSTTALLADGQAGCADLDEAPRDRLIEVSELGFIDAGRRAGEDLIARQLTEPDAAGRLFRGLFFGSDASSGWIRHLESAAAIARVVPAYELTMPDSVASLSRSAKALLRTGTFRG